MKHGLAAVQVCSTAYVNLGRAQAKALGYPDLPIVVVPHPFPGHTAAKVRELAEQCVEDIARLLCETRTPGDAATAPAGGAAAKVEVTDDLDAINLLFRERRWTDGLPIVPPVPERVERMLRCCPRAGDEIIASLAPGFGAATVERIAINAVMAGCDPEYLPVLIAAVEAVTSPEFHLQSIQATTNAAAVWLIVNGPIVERLHMNPGINCLGHGNWANATLGRALHLILQNIGRALPGEMDRATQGQPGKYTFCCAENTTTNPWAPLHVERGYAAENSTVTVVAAAGTLNMLSREKDATQLLRVLADSIRYPTSNDYWCGGEPWLILGPEHAEVLAHAGLSKAEVKHRLWQESKMPAHRMGITDLKITQIGRRAELGTFLPDTVLPISPAPEDIQIIVAGGPGLHSVYVPTFGDTRSVTRKVM